MSSQNAVNGAISMSQVKIQLSSRDPDLKLPGETGPILVSTSMCSSDTTVRTAELTVGKI